MLDIPTPRESNSVQYSSLPESFPEPKAPPFCYLQLDSGSTSPTAPPLCQHSQNPIVQYVPTTHNHLWLAPQTQSSAFPRARSGAPLCSAIRGPAPPPLSFHSDSNGDLGSEHVHRFFASSTAARVTVLNAQGVQLKVLILTGDTGDRSEARGRLHSASQQMPSPQCVLSSDKWLRISHVPALVSTQNQSAQHSLSQTFSHPVS